MNTNLLPLNKSVTTLTLLALLPSMLASCGGGSTSGNTNNPQPSTPTLTTIDLSANKTMLKLGNTPTLQVVLKDQDGKPMQLPVTYTSSLPDVVKVDSSGKLSSDRLTPTGKPAVITVSAGGKSATLNIETYGLEFRIGTYQEYDGKTLQEGIYPFWRIRTPKIHQIDYTNFGTITIPNGTKWQTDLNMQWNSQQDRKSGMRGRILPKDLGIYKLAITVDGESYEAQDILKFANFIAPPTKIKSEVNSSVVSFNANLPSSAISAEVDYNTSSAGAMGGWNYYDKLPVNVSDLKKGEYRTIYCVADFSKEIFNPQSDFSMPIPAQMNTACSVGDTFIIL